MTTTSLKNEDNNAEKVILVGVGQDAERSLKELCELCKTANLQVMRVYCQKITPDSRYYCGKGKAQEIREAVVEIEADAVITDDELTPSQVSALEDVLEVKVVDRTAVILDIFASRARSSEGKIQVELAQQKYLYARLAGSRDNLSRLGGGIGTKGPGEKKLEVDRRHIRRRIHELERDLKDVKRRRELLRKNRKTNGFRTVALMGYTNAGKSTLLTALTGSDAYSENILFATLDPLTRNMPNDDGLNILVTDTVGFIEKLPHHLIDAFRATLEESTQADLLLHVIDASSPDYVRQTEVADSVLEQLSAYQKRIYVYNKMDLVQEEPLLRKQPNCFVSAMEHTNIDELRNMIVKMLQQEVQSVRLCVPYDRGDVINFIHENGKITSLEYTEKGVEIAGEIEQSMLYKIKEFMIENAEKSEG